MHLIPRRMCYRCSVPRGKTTIICKHWWKVIKRLVAGWLDTTCVSSSAVLGVCTRVLAIVVCTALPQREGKALRVGEYLFCACMLASEPSCSWRTVDSQFTCTLDTRYRDCSRTNTVWNSHSLPIRQFVLCDISGDKYPISILQNHLPTRVGWPLYRAHRR